ncbi:MAG: GAK system CofD-like protein [Desulfococcaceae bacterium]|nr:GAK system CofD-like protein [Desulfococcaceae bacterium]
MKPQPKNVSHFWKRDVSEVKIRIPRTVSLPSPLVLERYRRTPELGPKVLFFSGGSALKDTSLELVRYTHNSIHIITPFDSGGSSALLREAFHMPAIGDVRNRLLALADRSLHGNPEIFRLFAHRFPRDGEPENLAGELEKMIRGKHELVSCIPDPMRKIIRHNLYLFRGFMPHSFDLRKASLGNLILSGGYLDNRRNFDIIIYIFSKLVQVRGIVRPVVNKYLHLITELEDGSVIIGQHNLTGKESSPISSKVKKIFLSSSRENPFPADVRIRNKMKEMIGEADLICYPMGSFWSSLVANLLPSGVGSAVAANLCPKVFIPNTGGKDPETFGMTFMEQVEQLTEYLRKDDPRKLSVTDLLNFIVIDSRNGDYGGDADTELLKQQGVEIIDIPLISPESRPYIDEKLLVPVLLSLA